MRSRKIDYLRVTFVYEYGCDKDDWMLSSLLHSLQARLPAMKAERLYGPFRKFRPGGMHPARLANLVWIYLRVAGQLLFFPPDVVLVRTTPPGVQLWTVWWAGWRKVPVYCWLMDYHPEMEIRQLQRRGFTAMARWLQLLDESLMPRFAGIITLDRAMVNFARMRAKGVEVWEHPTWSMAGAASLQPVSYRPGEEGRPLRLAYSGNLGAAHDLATFGQLLAELVRRRPVEVYVIGTSSAGTARFKDLTAGLGVSLHAHPRVTFPELRGLYERWRIDAGIVLLASESAGLVSPSKFAGYINFGLPLIYSGPAGTNTAEVCVRFGGGFWLPENSSADTIQKVAASVLDANQMARGAEGAKAAAAHFSALNSDSLANLLAPQLARAAGRSLLNEVTTDMPSATENAQ